MNRAVSFWKWPDSRCPGRGTPEAGGCATSVSRCERGEVLGVAGLMGAGRTELLECLFGTSPEPPTGRILLEGREVRFASPADAKQAGVALVTEDRKRLGLFPQLNVRENVTICTLEEIAAGGLIGRTAERRAARESIDLLSIKTPGARRSITGLSGGNQQKAIIARWLRTQPKVCCWTTRPVAWTSEPRPSCIT